MLTGLLELILPIENRCRKCSLLILNSSHLFLFYLHMAEKNDICLFSDRKSPQTTEGNPWKSGSIFFFRTCINKCPDICQQLHHHLSFEKHIHKSVFCSLDCCLSIFHDILLPLVIPWLNSKIFSAVIENSYSSSPQAPAPLLHARSLPWASLHWDETFLPGIF